MRKGGGPKKGGAFERRIAKDVVKAFKKHGIKQRECWRSTNSGGHAMACGDLEMSDRLVRLFPYVIECKHYKKIRIHNLLLAKKESKELKWLDQTCEAKNKFFKSYKLSLGAVLVMKANNMPIITMRWLGYKEREQLSNCIQIEGRFWQVISWTKFLTNAVKESRGKSANART